MKTPNFSIQIPEPCHEDWNSMQPDEKGRYCLSCNKSVYDFSGKTDAEIHQTLTQNKDQKICGRFSKSQLNRPLNIRIDLSGLPKNMSMTKVFAVALFLAFGSMLFSCTDLKGNKIGEIEITPFTQQSYPTMGAPLMRPLPPDSLVTGDVKASPESGTCSVMTGEVSYVEEPPIMGKIRREPVVTEPDSTIETTDTTAIIPDYSMLTTGAIVYIAEPLPDSSAERIVEELISTSEQPVLTENELLVYPNPGKGEFTFSYKLNKASDIRLDIYSEKGELLRTLTDLRSQHSGTYNIPVNLDSFAPGMYFASWINNGTRITKRFVIER